MDFLVAIMIRSTIQINQPRNILIMPATNFPSDILTTMPRIHAVKGMIARMRLTMYDRPK